MREEAQFFLDQNASFLFDRKELSIDHIKAPVQWGVTTTAFATRNFSTVNKALGQRSVTTNKVHYRNSKK